MVAISFVTLRNNVNIMLISLKTAQPIWIFFHQKMRNWYLGNYKKKKKKKTGRKIFTHLNRRCKKMK